MERRAFLGTLAGRLLAAPVAAKGQRAGRIYRLGVMAVVPTPQLAEAARHGLRDLGWTEGQNLTIEYRYSMGQDTLFPGFAAELVRLDVDVIAAIGDPAVRAAKEATTSIPIVMVAGAANRNLRRVYPARVVSESR